MNSIRIRNDLVGNDFPCYIVAEIGINHNGDIEIAKKLIDAAVKAGCNAVKFQKRTIDIVYSPEELARPRDNPFGKTNGDLKYGLEFGLNEYMEIDKYCKSKYITWFASCWDEKSVDFMEQFNVPCYKIASPSLTDTNLLEHTRSKGKPIILSTGMSTLEQIDSAISVLGKKDLIVMHICSTYPSRNDELNLRVITTLKERYGIPVGYSGHDVGLCTTVAAIPLGACVIERHITLDRTMWGSDQSASIEPQGFVRLVHEIKEVESALGDGIKRVLPEEEPIMAKLRRVNTLIDRNNK